MKLQYLAVSLVELLASWLLSNFLIEDGLNFIAMGIITGLVHPIVLRKSYERFAHSLAWSFVVLVLSSVLYLFTAKILIPFERQNIFVIVLIYLFTGAALTVSVATTGIILFIGSLMKKKTNNQP